MPKYWEKQIFAHRSFPEMVEKQKTEKKREKEIKKRESQCCKHHHGWHMQAAWTKMKRIPAVLFCT